MRLLLTLSIAALLAACGDKPAPEPTTAAASAPPPYQEVKVDLRAPHQFDAAIRAEDLARHIQRLSSDEFEGRDPGTLGERMTLAYLEAELTRAGFLPAVPDGKPCPSYPCDGATYTQRVPMVSTKANPATALTLKVGDSTQTLAMGKDMVLGTQSGERHVEIADSEVVFVGYGVNAPEQQWNDFEGLDVKGKTLVVLVNDPGFLRKDPELFKGKAMTYYGRWTYKFEEAARQGAAAALIVHDEEPAGYGWDVVANSWGGVQHDLPASEDSSPKLRAQGWITMDAAKALFTAAGQDLDALRMAADARGFKPVPLGARMSVTLDSEIETAYSNNIVAILPGSERPDESVFYTGHWDHLGKGEGKEGEDVIFNGAIDNADGLAAALEIAEAFGAMQPRPARSIVVMLPTLEESGLLGSRYYAEHPVLPLAKTVGVINMDALPIIGRTRDFAISGYGQNDLQDILADVLATQQRVLKDEPTPERGFYFRSDHFNFARKGVPALHARAGLDHVARGEDYGRERSEDYTKVRYHKPGDEFDPDWDYAGIVEDVTVYFEIGRRLATGSDWPGWKEGSEFKALRDASSADRAAPAP
jgi:Zn-dependent M28 family amino/carboxypeptidase